MIIIAEKEFFTLFNYPQTKLTVTKIKVLIVILFKLKALFRSKK
jgi:hypothetical protein